MTRINLGIKASELPNKLLLAEHREIKRIPNTIKSGKAKIKDIPEKFTLGKGHVKFFYTRLGYLKKRYIELRQECLNRGFNITDYEDTFEGISEALFNDYDPSEYDRKLLIERIESKGFKLLE